jgi:hypothetical protein
VSEDRISRDEDLLGRKTSRLRRELLKTWNEVKRGFEDQAERADRIMDYWDAYNCRLGPNQYYNGEAEVYIPIVRDAVNAIATRDTNQLCPQNGQYFEAVAADGSINGPIVDLLHEYGDRARIKTDIVKTLIITGQIEGQFNLYVDWAETAREIVSREKRPAMQGGFAVPGQDEDEEVPEIVVEGCPAAEILHDSDILICPTAADSVEEALAGGGFVAIVRRWSKGKIRRLAEAGLIRDDAAKDLEDTMGSAAKGVGIPPDTEKLLAEIAGIRKKGTEATVWEVWKRLPLNAKGTYEDDGSLWLCRMFFGPDQMVLGCARNPNWNDRCQLISRPVEKVPGVVKGRSPIEGVISLQYEANDAANEAADAAHYSAMPVILRDPASGNEPIILNIAAVIDAPPNAIKALEWPDLTPRAVIRIQYCIQQIFQSLGVNPSMLPQQTNQSRRNQAQIAQEQQIDLLTTAIRVSVLEEVMTELAGWWVDLDYQYRDRDLIVRTHGVAGVRTNMQPIPPLRNREFYRFRWWGADQARYNAVLFQQMIAFINLMSNPALAEQMSRQGKQVDLTPIIEASTGAIFGPRYKVVKDLRAQMSLDPEIENKMLADGMEVPVSIFDDDAKHMQAHSQAAMQSGDPNQIFRAHMQKHMLAMAAKQQAMIMGQMQQPVGPGGGGQGPKPGGQVMPMRPNRGPPGTVHPDRMPAGGGVMMPRKF